MHVAGLIGAIWGMGGRRWVQTLPPQHTHTRLVSPCGAMTEQSILRFSGRKIFPGFQVNGSVSITIWKLVSQLAKQEPPDSKVPNRLPPLRRGAPWEMEFYVAVPFPIFFIRGLQRLGVFWPTS